jgi:LacI family transcriptional regulator
MGAGAGGGGGDEHKPPSMLDVARAAGVSTATVSRVLNTPGLVAAKTAERVDRAIRELGYRPNVFAQGLMTNRSRLLGVLLPDIHGEFYSGLIHGADAEARRRGYHLLVSSETRGQGEETLFNSNIVGFLAGLAVMITEPKGKLLEQAASSGLPLVVIDEELSGAKIDRVLVDNAAGTREAVTHLLTGVSPGRCWFVGGPRENYDTAARAAAFVATLGAAGPSRAENRLRFGEYSVEWGRRAGRELLTGEGAPKAGAPVGVLAGNDEIALGIMQTAAELGLSIPEQVRLVGFDDTRLASVVRPELSSVRVPTAEVGSAAVAALVDRLDEPDRPGTTVLLATRLVVRASSRGT